MRTARIHLDEPIEAGAEFDLPRDRARYVSRVLRLRGGAALVLADGRGGEYHARIASVDGDRVRVRVDEHHAVERESALDTELVLGVSKGERMDIAIQKAVELGVTRITPVLTRRSVVRLDERRAARRHAHWTEVVRSACEQCGRNRRPALTQPGPLGEWLAGRDREALGVVLVPGAGTSFSDLARPRHVQLLVGPEGGLADEEIEAAVAQGLVPVGLGPRVLRTETAAITVLGLVQGLWGDLVTT